ncbi:hypothetical protein EBZ37_03985 [bacterium]|nr:hypothetical protein [bacterium]
MSGTFKRPSRFWIFIVLVVAASAGRAWLGRQAVQRETTGSAPGTRDLVTTRVEPSSTAEPEPLHLPLKLEVLKEVHQDPHAVPPSLVRFARAIAARMKQAKQDRLIEGVLVLELKACALSEDVADTARIFCVHQFERMQSGEQARELRRVLPEHLVRTLEALGD